jgi:crotonobetainyl-CoA:carnitine CoA-transferase CaiB-like acyl-CoA transferase
VIAAMRAPGGALDGLRIIELSERPAGEYCGRLLADFGAEVVKIERPGVGSPTRSAPPRIGEAPALEASGLFAYLNTNKSSVVLDLTASAGIERLHQLIAGADAVIDDHDEAWLAAIGLKGEAAAPRHPHAVFAAIRPFGAGAPDDWSIARPLNIFHASGWGYHTPSAADPERPPLKGAGRFLVDYEAAFDAALCVASALYARSRTGRGQSVEVSQLEVMVSRADAVVGRLLAGDEEPGADRWAYDLNGPAASFACQDGYVYLVVLHRGHWRALRELMAAPAWMTAFPDDWLETGVTPTRNAAFRDGFADWARPRRKDEVADAGQKLGLPIAPVNDASDLPRSVQFRHRGYFQRLDHPVLGPALYPATPYRLSATPTQLTRPAPRLGEHTEAVLSSDHRTAPQPRIVPARAPAPASRGGPLQGLRVLEITKVWAGPHAGKILSFLGAEVIKVESRGSLDEMRGYGVADPDRAPYFLSVNPEVLSVAVDMKSDAGLARLRDMAAASDIVLNNIRPGAMERLGLDPAALRAIRPDIVSVSIKMYGNDGPLGYQTGYAPCFAALGGANCLVGYEGEPPSGLNARYGDTSVGIAAALAAVAALLHRDRTGEGQFVDVSAVEVMASLVGDSLLDYELTSRAPVACGNRDPELAPHGCYPCVGGEWISIAVATDHEWRALCEALGQAELAHDPRFAHAAARLAAPEALDAALSALTRAHVAGALDEQLRRRGVPAFKSRNSLDLVSDAHLWERGFFRLVSDAATGQRPILGAPWRFSGGDAAITHGAPRLGEHNAYVYGDILGLTAEQIEELVQAGVIA